MSDIPTPPHCVVTGGSSGIGAAVVEELLNRGCEVTVLDINGGEHTAANYLKADITDEVAVGDAFDEAIAERGTVQFLVMSAGVRGQFVPALDLDLERARRLFDINIFGTLIPAREMVRRLGGGQGSIVAISSTTAFGGWVKQADYGTSKAAVGSLVAHLAVEWAELDVRVNAVAPGHTLTPMVESMVKEGYDLEPVKQRTPLGRLATPDQMAGEVAHLLLDATHVTGQCLAVDGGWTVVGK